MKVNNVQLTNEMSLMPYLLVVGLCSRRQSGEYSISALDISKHISFGHRGSVISANNHRTDNTPVRDYTRQAPLKK
ncbi:hypothetical protein TNCV_507321 [Trichonephila clavipes]|nr:hypothetical protein TNCV_507321 [Trichonephila clavipes]